MPSLSDLMKGEEGGVGGAHGGLCLDQYLFTRYCSPRPCIMVMAGSRADVADW